MPKMESEDADLNLRLMGRVDFQPATLEQKRKVLDKIDPDDDGEMDYITEPDEDGGRWFLTYHFIDEEE